MSLYYSLEGRVNSSEEPEDMLPDTALLKGEALRIRDLVASLIYDQADADSMGRKQMQVLRRLNEAAMTIATHAVTLEHYWREQ